MKPLLKAPGTKRLKLKCDEPLSNNAFKFNLRRYRMVGAPVLPASIMLLGIFILPESPRWLVIRGRLPEALEVIHSLRENTAMPGADQSTAQVEAELMDLWSAVEKEFADRGGAPPAASAAASTAAPSSVPAADPAARVSTVFAATSTAAPAAAAVAAANQSQGFFRTLWTILLDVGVILKGEEGRAFKMALWLAFFNQATCSTSIINYAPKILERAGVSDHEEAVLFASAISVTKAAGVTASMFLVDRAGRRFLLVGGSYAAAAAMMVLAAAYGANNALAALLAMCGFMLAFSDSWAVGPAPDFMIIQA